MKSAEFNKVIHSQLGNHTKLPKYPFSQDFNYIILPGAEENFIDNKVYCALLSVNQSHGNSVLLSKPHFADSEKQLFCNKTSWIGHLF